MWNDLHDYLSRHYQNADLVVEVGVGCFTQVADALQDHYKMNIIMTDIKPCHDRVVQDDITQPNLKIYKNADLIYSIRPPEDLHPYLMRLAENVGADLIIKPLSTDSINTPKKMELINYKRSTFYKMCHP